VHVIGGPGLDLPPPGRFTLPLIDSRRESPTAMTFRFATESTGFRYLSNQFVRLALPDVTDPWGAIRSFSLSSSPSEPGFISITCKISDTPFKQALAVMRPGQTGVVYGPLGAFLFDRQRPAVFLAGGIGITPLRGMIRYAHDTSFRHDMVLLYSARTPDELVFRSELDAIAREGGRLHAAYSVTRPKDTTAPWEGRAGRIDERWIREATRGLHGPRFYVCGLPEMVGEMIRILEGPLGVPGESIDYEVFRGF
jgi:glycine betaine catabolism B